MHYSYTVTFQLVLMTNDISPHVTLSVWLDKPDIV